MKIFGLTIEIPPKKVVIFPVTTAVLATNDPVNALAMANKITQLLNRSAPGIHTMVVMSGPDRIKVQYDPRRTDADAIKRWLNQEGLPV